MCFFPLTRMLWLCSFVPFVLPVTPAQTPSTLAPEAQAKIATAVKAYMEETGTPSVVLGMIRHGEVVYTTAFGKAQVDPAVLADVAMPYGIGSVSKQFTAAAVMVLVERGKIRLDDSVATYLPELPHGQEVTLRQVLNQVSGYEDYYTEDYPTLDILSDVDSHSFMMKWAARPLDFAPGTKWQYSNTNYLIAAEVVQKVAGEPFFDFLERYVLEPAGVTQAIDLDKPDVPKVPKGYMHYGLGPMRPASVEGKGTLIGAGELAMPVGDLLRWDTVVLHRNAVLRPSSWRVLESDVVLPDGRGTGYGMGLELSARKGERLIGHSGGLSGFVTFNELFPDEDSGFAVIANSDQGGYGLLKVLADLATAQESAAAPQPSPRGEKLLRSALEQLEGGTINRAILAPNLAAYFKPEVLADYKQSLAGLGSVTADGMDRQRPLLGVPLLVQRRSRNSLLGYEEAASEIHHLIRKDATATQEALLRS